MRTALKIVVFFLVFIAAVAASATYAFHRYLDPVSVAAELEDQVESLTGYPCTITGGVKLSWYPWIALTAENVVLVNANGTGTLANVGEIRAAIKVKPLFEKRIELDVVYITAAHLNLDKDAKGEANWDALLSLSASEPVAGSGELPFGFSMDSFRFAGVSIQDSSVSFRDAATGFQASLENISLDIDANKPWHYITEFTARSSGVLQDMHIQASGDMHIVDFSRLVMATSELSASGSLNYEGRILPLAFDVQGKYLPSKDRLLFTLARSDFDGAKLAAKGVMQPALSPDWKVMADAEVTNLSLPYWFEFGEYLPSSLQHALDALEGKLSVQLSSKGVWADSLEATVLGMPLTGVGGVKDFSKPVVYIDVEGPFIDVNEIFPEIKKNPPKELPMPARPGPAVLREDPDAVPVEDGIEVGYDIRVRGQKAKAMSFDLEGLSFRCWPAPVTGTYTSYTIDSFYGGSVDSLLTIRSNLALDVSVKDVETREVSELITGFDVMGGVINAKASMHSNAKTVWGLLAGLNGNATARLKNGFVRTLAKRDGKGSKVRPFHKLEQLDIRLEQLSQSKRPDEAGDILPYFWKLDLGIYPEGTPDELDINVHGGITLSAKTAFLSTVTDADSLLLWKGLPTINGASVPLEMGINGVMSLDLEKELFSLSDATVTMDGLEAKGDMVAVNILGPEESSGHITSAQIQLPKFMDTLGLPLWESTSADVLKKVSINTDFRRTANKLAFSGLRGQLDETTFRGDISIISDDADVYAFDLDLGKVDIDAYLPPSSNSSEREPWKLSWLDDFTCFGNVHFDSARYKKMHFTDVYGDINTGNGQLAVTNVSGKGYGGRIVGDFKGKKVIGGLKSELKIAATDFDLERAIVDTSGAAFAGGNTTGYLDVNGILGASADVPSRVSGIWGFDVTDGFYSVKADKKGKRDRSTFNTVSADGVLEKGVLKNDNLTLSSPFVSMEGEGELDLVQKTIDYAINVTYAEIPTFPIMITGDLKNPKTSVREALIVPRTLEKLGGSIFSIFKGVLTSPIKALDIISDIAGGNQNATDDRGLRDVVPRAPKRSDE